MRDPHAGGLLLEVGVLATGHLVDVHLGRTRLRRGVEGRVVFADLLPVVGEAVERLEVELGVARGVLQGGHHRVEVGLRGAAAHGGQRQVHHVDPGVARPQDAGGVDAAGVVGVEVDGDAHLVLQGLDQLLGGVGTAQARHVLDGQQMSSHALQFLGQLDVVLEREGVAAAVEDVAGVAERALAQGVGVLHGIHRHAQVGQVVERVEDAEDVHARGGRMLHEAGHHMVGVVGVAHRIGASEEHLEADVRDLLAQLAQALPRILAEEAHGGVEGGPAPHLQREQAGLGVADAAGQRVGAGEHVEAAHARGHERLVGVAEGGVGDEQALLLERPLGEFLRAQLEQQVARALGQRGGQVGLGQRRRVEGLGRLVSLGVRVAVDDDVAEEVQQLRGPVFPAAEGEELRRGVDERRGGLAAAELRVQDDVLEEGDVGLDPADPELRQRPVHAVHGDLVGLPGGDDLHEHRVVEGRDDRARVAHAAVEADAEAAGRAVGEDLAVVGGELVLRVLGGDAALDGVAVAGHLVLHRHADLLGVQRVALGDEDLRPHEVEARDDLGHRVLDLDARVHLDEEPLMAVEVVEELHRARVVVADLAGQPGGRVAELLDDVLGQAERRGHLDDLLVAALHRAVALEEVDDVAVAVAEHLHLDVLGPGDVLLEEDRRVAEGALGLALGLVEQARQLRLLLHHAHAAASATEGRLDDEREADLAGGLHRLVAVGDGVVGAGQGGHADALGHGPGGGLVTHHVEQLRARAHEGDARLGAGAGEGRVLAQEPVAGMDGVDPLGLGRRHDALDVQIRGHRALALADQVRFIGLEAVDAEAVLLRVDGHGAQVQFGRGAEDADGDLGAVRRHELPEWADGLRGGIDVISGRHGRSPQWLRKTGVA